MTMNGAVIPILAFFIVAGEEQGVAQAQLDGTIQNDILKEFMVRNTYIYPPAPSMRIVSDIIAYTSANMPKFNSISISGYHMQRPGRRRCRSSPSPSPTARNMRRRRWRRGSTLTPLRAPVLLLRDRHELLHGGGEAARRAQIVARRDERARREGRTLEDAAHALPDLRRVADRAGPVQQRHPAPPSRRWRPRSAAPSRSTPTRSTRQSRSPTDFSARIARNTQIVLQEETGITHVVDPLGGSYYVEALTQDLYDRALELIARADAEGGMANAVAAGWPKAMIEEASAARAARVDKGEDVIVGVNKLRCRCRTSFRSSTWTITRSARARSRGSRR